VTQGETPARTGDYHTVLSVQGASLGAHAVMPAARPSSGCGILSWFVPPALAGEVAREAAAERDAVLAAAGEKVPRGGPGCSLRGWPSKDAPPFLTALTMSTALASSSSSGIDRELTFPVRRECRKARGPPAKRAPAHASITC
jgi:hypothetical protein